ncbi:MAG: hypothetical protein MJZ28_06780 [Paludibacteraceae bacterium]|nr:hypothetical protein [Paludibacteraceae bacterium]
MKIVLDADVLIHFAKAERLSILPTILQEYEHVVLSAVYEEVRTIRQQLDNQIQLLRKFILIVSSLKELYTTLKSLRDIL